MSSSQMTEKHVRIFFETLAKILSEREGVKITVKIRRKDEIVGEENKPETA